MLNHNPNNLVCFSFFFFLAPDNIPDVEFEGLREGGRKLAATIKKKIKKELV